LPEYFKKKKNTKSGKRNAHHYIKKKNTRSGKRPKKQKAPYGGQKQRNQKGSMKGNKKINCSLNPRNWGC
jgi:hypothetical protein